jgi:hypothetical protein
VLGPLSFQAEYYATWVDPTAAGTPFFFHGAYVYGSYFLTGEHRPYSRDQGYFTQVTPFTNFFRVRGSDGNMLQGWGAWEVAARFSTMNLSDKSIQGQLYLRDEQRPQPGHLRQHLRDALPGRLVILVAVVTRVSGARSFAAHARRSEFARPDQSH